MAVIGAEDGAEGPHSDVCIHPLIRVRHCLSNSNIITFFELIRYDVGTLSALWPKTCSVSTESKMKEVH